MSWENTLKRFDVRQNNMNFITQNLKYLEGPNTLSEEKKAKLIEYLNNAKSMVGKTTQAFNIKVILPFLDMQKELE